MKRDALYDLSGYGICSICGGQCEPPRLWCPSCLRPFIQAGEKFQPKITRVTVPA